MSGYKKAITTQWTVMIHIAGLLRILSTKLIREALVLKGITNQMNDEKENLIFLSIRLYIKSQLGQGGRPILLKEN